MRVWSWDARLVGGTAAGQEVVFHGAHVVNSTVSLKGRDGSNTKLRLVATKVQIGVPGSSATFRYGLTNLRRILGNEVHKCTTPQGQEIVQYEETKAGDPNPRTRSRNLGNTLVVAGLVYGLVNVRTDGETILCATMNEKDYSWEIKKVKARF